MKTRFQTRHENKGKGLDPFVIEEFDWDNERADSSYVHPQGARGCDGLTWELLDEAIGASSSLRDRNLPRTASNKRARIPHSRLFEVEVEVEVEDEACSADEVEEEGPHDDADLTDSEDAPNGSNDGENDLAGNILDEFEDGY
jgi:hypothetical protein